MSRLPTLLATALFSGLVCGCDPTFYSEGEEWRFSDVALVSGAHSGFHNTESLLPDTPLCPTMDWQGSLPEEFDEAWIVENCIEQSLEGPASFEQRDELTCAMMESAGEVVWRFDAIDCEAEWPTDPPVSDRLVLQVADPASVTAEVHQWFEEMAMDGLETVPAGAITEELLIVQGEPFRLIEDSAVTFFVRLWDPEKQQPVAWRGDEGEVYANTLAGDVQLQPLSEEEPGWIRLSLAAGAEAALFINVNGEAWEAARLVGVSAEEADSLELVATLLAADDEGAAMPVAARAVVRDAQGNPLFGAPVDWKVRKGRLAVTTDPNDGANLPGPDYAGLSHACYPPSELGGEFSVVLKASYEGTSDKVELSWTYPDDGGSDEDWVEPEECMGSCRGCATQGTENPGMAWLLLGGLGLAARRRRGRCEG